jgi:glycosyltransferase involved in cell wall biosynthesis
MPTSWASDMRFKVVMAGRDCFPFVQSSLQSVAAQTDREVDVCVVDDASADLRQPAIMEQICGEQGWEFIRNEVRRGSLYNHVAAVRALAPEDEDVIVSVDADDRLSRPDALSIVRQYYDRHDPALTYGSYVPDPYDSRVMPARRLPDDVILGNSYRAFSARDDDDDPVWFNHLRTLKSYLFSLLDPAVDFIHPDGSWLITCYDLAVTIPVLELAAGNYLFLPDILYLYTRDNPLSDCYVNTDSIQRDKAHIFSLPAKKPLSDIVLPRQLAGSDHGRGVGAC